MKRNLLWMALMGISFFSYGQGCAKHTKLESLKQIQVKIPEQNIFGQVLEKSKSENENSIGMRLVMRGTSCSSYANYRVVNYFTTYSINSSIKFNLDIDADHGELMIKGCRPETIAYYIDGVRIRVGSVHIL